MANKWYSADNKPLDIPTFQDLQDVTGQVFDDAGLYIGPAELPKQQLVIDNVTKRQYYAPKEYTENAIRYAEAKRNEYFKPEDWFGMENIKADYTLGEQVIGGTAALGKSITGFLAQLPTKITYTGAVFANELSKAYAKNNLTDIAKMKNGMFVEQENLYRMSMKNWENTLIKYGLANEAEIQQMAGGKVGSMIGDVAGSLLIAAALSGTGGLPAIAALFGTNQFADIMEEGLAKGLSHDKAFSAALKSGFFEGGLEAFGFKMWRSAATLNKSFRNLSLAFAWEAAQEGSQQTAESLITNYYGIREQTFTEILADVCLSALVGGLVGFAGAGFSGQVEQRNLALRKTVGMNEEGRIVTPETEKKEEGQKIQPTQADEKFFIEQEIAEAKKTGDNTLYNLVKYSANAHGITDEATIDKMYPVARKAIADGATNEVLLEILGNQVVAYKNQLEQGQTDTKETQKAVEEIKLVTDPNRENEWKESRKSELEKAGMSKEQANILSSHMNIITDNLSKNLGFDVRGKMGLTFEQNLNEVPGTRGQITFEKTLARVALNKNADPTTVEHEFFHYIDRVVLQAAKEGNTEAQKLVKKRNEVIKQAKSELKKQGFIEPKNAEERAKLIKQGKRIMPIDEELLTGVYEKWLWNGAKSEDATEQKLFEAIRQFFRDVYDSLKGLMGVRISPEMDAYFKAMTGEVPQTLYQFGGITARTADHASLTRAGEMVAEGKSNEEIRKETGWFRGVDGKWRFEISDKDMEISDKAYDYFANYMEASDRAQETYAKIKELSDKRKNETDEKKLAELENTIEKYEDDFRKANLDKAKYSEYLTLEELIKHDKLFKAYPAFRNIAVAVSYHAEDNRLATYSIGRNAIYFNGDMFNDKKHKYNKAYPKEKRIKEIKSALMHEVQHAIQEREGFATGASLEAFREAPVRDRITKDIMEKRKKQAKADFAQELEKRTGNKEIVKELLAEEKKFSEVLDKFFKNEIPQAEATKEQNKFHDLLKKAGISYSDYFKLYDDMMKKNGYDYKRVERFNPYDPYELYRMVAGEIEARNTEARLEMSEEERAATSPESTQDIKNADAIVVFDDGTALVYQATEAPTTLFQGGTFDTENPNIYYQQETNEQLFRNNQALKEGAKVLDKAPTNEQVEEELSVIRSGRVAEAEPKRGFGLAESIGDFVLTVRQRVGTIDKRLKYAFDKLDFNEKMYESKYGKNVVGYIKKYRKLDDTLKRELDYLILNKQDERIREFVRQNDMLEEYNQARTLLDNLYVEGNKAGMDMGFLQEYFPTKVVDPEGLITYLKGTDKWTEIERALAEIDPNNQMSIEDRANAINNILRGYNRADPISKQGFQNERLIFHKTPEMMKFYAPSDEALMRYVSGMSSALAIRNAFNVKNAFNAEESIGGVVQELIKSGQITYKEESFIRKMLKARLNYARTAPIVALLKNFGYLGTMNNITSAVTQIGDLYANFYKYNFGTAMKALFGKREITKEDLHIDSIWEEFADAGWTGIAVNKLFSVIGLNKFDKFGKETAINGAWIDLKERLKNNDVSLLEDLSAAFGSRAKQVMEDIKNNNITEDVKLLLWTQLADTQPLGKSGVPVGYLNNPHGRIVYQLKTYTINQLSLFYADGVYKINKGLATKNKKLFWQGIGNTAKLALLLTIFNAGADALKNLIMGRKIDISDTLLSNMLWNIGVSKYTFYRGQRDGYARALLENYLLPPQISMGDDAYMDIKKIATGKRKPSDTIAVTYVPFGRMWYWWFGGGRTQEKKKGNKPFEVEL